LLAQSHILQALHSSGVGGHSGIHATYHKIKSLFAWPRLKASVHSYVQACSVCQQAKTEHVKSPGLLQPLPIPTQPWSTISMDFIEGLPKSGGFDVILVVVDKFTKYAHFYRWFTHLQLSKWHSCSSIISTNCMGFLMPSIQTGTESSSVQFGRSCSS